MIEWHDTLMTRHSGCLGAALVAVVVSAAVAPTAFAEGDGSSKLSFHGSLTQAYARTDGETVLGIPERGTSDYRTVSLQFGYALGDNDRMVVQLAHERIGESPGMAFRQDVELDWAFFEHRFSDAFEVKAGRVQIPRGIFNEIRDIGTLLPFYRPPSAFYSETVSASETVDGVVVSSHLRRDQAWSIDADLYCGGWNSLESGRTGLVRTRVENALGVHAWLQTPLEGLRVGGGVHRMTTRSQATATTQPQINAGQYNVAAEGVFGPVVLRAEHAYSHSPGIVFRANYAQGGIKVWRGVVANAEVQNAELELSSGRLLGTFGLIRDFGVGLNYEFRPTLILKLEAHHNEGSGIGTPSPKARYGMASVAVSF